MARLHQQLKNLCARNRDGSFATQANRRAMLVMFADQLGRIGFNANQLGAADLKGRHVNALLRTWRAEGVTDATIKNRMSVIRWWAEKVNNAGAVKSNAELGIGNRAYVTNTDKSIGFERVDFSKFDAHVAQSLRMQDAFGLRREESMKFQPEYALQGQSVETATEIHIKGSWSKGGRERVIPVTNDKQREVLRFVAALAGKGSLIPHEKTYKTHLATFEAQTHAQGIGRTHGLRHGYAQTRYRELMGFDCPSKGEQRKLSDEEKRRDFQARLMISQELGHNRVAITSVYLGSWK